MKLMTTLAITAVLSGCASPSTALTSSSPSPSLSTSSSPSPKPSSSTTSHRAVEIALARTGGGTVDEVENEVEHGRAAWKVRIVKDGIRYDVYIDKTTEEIFRYENEGRH